MDFGTQGEQEDAFPTEEAAKAIKAIDSTTVHRICSGQVVLTLATAVKELVENSIDAGATSVEVRLRDHGISLLEVCDNGKGVEEDDFEGLTLKHHTSKLRDFGDLVGVKTFGFRGEALSSLCALSNLSIMTHHASKSVGTKLVYDHNGKLSSKSPVSRQVGTTVTLQNLFSTLPVRHKEFQRNIKKEFAKMVQVLYSYCLISTGVRIVCTNQTEKGKKTIVVSTDGHNSVKENISSVFGAKQVSSLLEFKQETASGDVLAEYGMPAEDTFQENCLFSIEGFISSCTHGQGRSSTDRQFYFINSRPCDPAKVSKVVNEVYHHYNRHQSPFVILNIRLREEDVDINVTPDKRQILVNHEKFLLATIKTSLIRLYENIPSTYSVQNGSLSSPLNRSFESSGSSSSNFASPNARSSNGRISTLTLKFGRNVSGSLSPSCPSIPLSSPGTPGMKRSFSDNSGSLSNKQRKLDAFFMSKSQSGACDLTSPVCDADVSSASVDSTVNGTDERNSNGHNSLTDGESDYTLEISQMDSSQEGLKSKDLKNEGIGCVTSYLDNVGETVVELCTPDKDFVIVQESNHNSEETNKVDNAFEKNNADGVANILTKFSHSLSPSNARNGSVECSKNVDIQGDDVKGFLSRFSSPSTLPSPKYKNAHSATDQFLNSLMAKKSERKTLVKNTARAENSGEDDVLLLDDERTVDLVEKCESAIDKTNKKIVMCEEYDPVDYVSNRKSKQVSFNLASLKTKISAAALKKARKDLIRRFHAKIAPTENKSAEDELKKEISKDMFAKMEILGQFNLGFIIVRLGSDLFIIDQHATDEKYNFETLQQTCVLQNQRLIIPQILELTAVNESILLDNIEIFRKNGFEFKIDEEKAVGRRVSLVSMPFSRGWEFGKEDIDELIFMLSDAPGVMCRPSRVRAMFASRACRKSVMIGTALTLSQMQKLVSHMGEIEQPWNCPHGRPTMRHLVNLDMISSAFSEETS